MKGWNTNSLLHSVHHIFRDAPTRVMVLDPETATNKFARLLSKLLSFRRFNANECDQTKQQFESLLKKINKYRKNECRSFDPVKSVSHNMDVETPCAHCKVNDTIIIIIIIIIIMHVYIAPEPDNPVLRRCTSIIISH